MSARQGIVEEVIRSRHTCKVLLEPEALIGAAMSWGAAEDEALQSMIETAGMAPFHRRAHEQTHRQGELASIVPWRFHVLDQQSCRQLLAFLKDRADNDSDPAWRRAWQSKIKDMLAACGALVQVTWLPDPSEQSTAADDSDSPVKRPSEALSLNLPMTPVQPALSENNIEHIAASGAAIQNLLLASEARGWLSYWSSGGILKDLRVFDYLGIGRQEALLGAVFLTPTVPEGAKTISGGLRDQRGETRHWCRRVVLT